MAMTELQHALSKVMSESMEVGHIASKCLEFGVSEKHPDLNENNIQRLQAEVTDLLGALMFLNRHLEDDQCIYFDDRIGKLTKIDKIEKFKKYSVELGMVQLNKP